MKAYYHARAGEYDDFWLRRGLYAERALPGWDEEVAEIAKLLRSLPPVRTLDVACGTGFLTRYLPGAVAGLDQSDRMLAIARERFPEATFVVGDALDLPFGDGAFGRVFASFFYCHLVADERAQFLAEARRVAPELIVLASRPGEGDARERWETRVLRDGSRWQVFKRVFEARELAGELGGRVLHEGRWFAVAAA